MRRFITPGMFVVTILATSSCQKESSVSPAAIDVGPKGGGFVRIDLPPNRMITVHSEKKVLNFTYPDVGETRYFFVRNGSIKIVGSAKTCQIDMSSGDISYPPPD
jgi:hypothetical protein